MLLGSSSPSQLTENLGAIQVPRARLTPNDSFSYFIKSECILADSFIRTTGHSEDDSRHRLGSGSHTRKSSSQQKGLPPLNGPCSDELCLKSLAKAQSSQPWQH